MKLGKLLFPSGANEAAPGILCSVVGAPWFQKHREKSEGVYQGAHWPE